MLTDMTRVTVLRPALPSRRPPCPSSNPSLPSCGSDAEVPAPSALALAHSISPAPRRIPSPAAPDAHRRTSAKLAEVRRCGSGGATEGIGRGWGALGNPKSCLLASTELTPYSRKLHSAGRIAARAHAPLIQPFQGCSCLPRTQGSAGGATLGWGIGTPLAFPGNPSRGRTHWLETE